MVPWEACVTATTQRGEWGNHSTHHLAGNHDLAGNYDLSAVALPTPSSIRS